MFVTGRTGNDIPNINCKQEAKKPKKHCYEQTICAYNKRIDVIFVLIQSVISFTLNVFPLLLNSLSVWTQE